MIGVGISAGLTGAKRARSIQDPVPALDLDWATDRSLPAAYGPTPSFSRASTGTFSNSSGVLTTAAINGPRFDHVYNGSSWVSKGLLVEEQRTNICLQSNFQTGWLGQGVSLSTNQTQAPDGTTTGAKITVSTSGNYRSIYRSISSGSANCISLFAKASGFNWITVIDQTGNFSVAWFNISNGTVGTVLSGYTAKIQDVGNGWYRCSVGHLTSWGAGSAIQFDLVNGDNTELATASGSNGVFLWGGQAESGIFSTSLIPTTTAAVTRSADVCQITGGDFSSFWNEPAGVFVAEGDTPASGTRSLVSVDNATANESSVLQTVGTNPLFVVTDGSVAQASIDAGTVSSGTAFKLSAAYTVNDFAVSKDGVTVVTDTSGTIPTPTQINIGTDAAGNYLCGHIARLRYYNTRLTNSQLQGLTL